MSERQCPALQAQQATEKGKYRKTRQWVKRWGRRKATVSYHEDKHNDLNQKEEKPSWMRKHPVTIDIRHPACTSGTSTQVRLYVQGPFSFPPPCSPPEVQTSSLKHSCKTTGMRGRIVRDILTHLLSFLSCLCLHSSLGGHQPEKKLRKNWTRPLPSTSLDSEHNSWAQDAARLSKWWAKADCKYTSLPL